MYRRFCTQKEAATELGIDLERMERLASMGKLVPYVAGEYQRYSIDDVQEFKRLSSYREGQL